MSAKEQSPLYQRYFINALIKHSSSHKTFSAHRLADDLPVIIKEMRLGSLPDWKAYDLFQREVEILKNLNHAGIPEFIDHFELEDNNDSYLYLVQEQVPGHSLQDKLKQGWRPNETQIKTLATDILNILIYLQGLHPPVIHRDIKPANIMLDKHTVYLVDFGAVQDVLRPEGSSTVVGTFGYMAPEQFSGRATVASDLYSLGATLVHILSGRSPSELPQKELQLDFKPYVNCSEQLFRWLTKLLYPSPEKRFQSAQQALKALNSPEEISLPSARPEYLRSSKPLNSKVELLHQEKRFSLRLPKGNLRADTIFMSFFTAVWLSFIAFWTVASFSGGIFFTLFSIPFWLVGFFLAYMVARQLFLSSDLEMNTKEFTLIHRLGPFSKIHRGKIQEISAVGLDMSYKVNDRPIYALYFECIGQRKVKFGTTLSRPEQAWVQVELLDFISKQLSPEEAERLLAYSEQIDTREL